MNAIALLKKQHRLVKSLFRKLEAGSADSADLLVELANNLVAHMDIEQKIFYPTVRTIKEDLVLESYEEHAVAELALKRLLTTPPEHTTFTAKVTTLKELIEHHVEEEEEELFPKVEKALGDEKLKAIGQKMQNAFGEALEKGYEAALPKVFAKTTADAANSAPAKTASKRSAARAA